MSALARAVCRLKFKLGIYEARQILRVERGGIVISCADSRYQPSEGIRYELSPDEWLLYSYVFFPRGYGEISSYDENFLKHECYYDIYSKSGLARPRGRVFEIFKNGKRTGYILHEHCPSSLYLNQNGESQSRYYTCIHINQWGTSSYVQWGRELESGMDKPICFATDVIQAAICVLSDLQIRSFKEDIINLESLSKDCDENPSSCILYAKLTKLLQECSYTDKYIHKQVSD